MAHHRSPLAPLVCGALVFAALVVAPGAWGGRLPGLTYSTAAAALLVLAGVVVAGTAVFRPTRRLAWTPVWVIAALLLGKLVLGTLDTPAGWRGEYTMLTPEPARTGAFVWRLGVHRFRVDRDVVFEGSAFDLPFLNDFHRYNGRAYAPPRATSQALRMVWTGWFDTPVATALTLHAQARGRLDVSLDSQPWVTAGLEPPAAPPRLSVGPGRHRLDLVYDKPADVVPAVFARVLLGGRPLAPAPWPGAGPVTRRSLAAAADGVVLAGLGVFLWLVGTAMRGMHVRHGAPPAGAVLAVTAMAVLAIWAVVRADAFVGLTQELRPGDDHLAYEGLARNVLEEGLLMPEGKARGEGRVFFFYPLYSYALAATHLVLGDGYASVVVMNAAAAAVIPVLLWLLGWRRLPWAAQLVGQGLLVAFVLRHNDRYVDSPLTDNLFIPLVLGTLVLAARALGTSRPRDAFLTGCAVAACATTRPSAFLLIPPLALLLAWYTPAARPWRRAWPVAALVAGYAVALLPVVARNWIMARQAVAMVTLSHAIPISLIPPEAQRPEFLSRAALWSWPESLRLAWTLVAADPWGVAWLEARKVLFTLGLTGLGPAGSPMIWELPLLCVAGGAAFVLRRVPGGTAAVLLTFLASHLAATTIAYPWTYGYKTILPVHLVFLFAAVHLLGVAPRSRAHA